MLAPNNQEATSAGVAKIDRIACPWLITRFIDDAPEFFYLPPGDVARIAAQTGAIPYDVPSVELGHHGDQCSLDAFIAKYGIKDQALDQFALIVRAVDTDAPALAKEAAGKAFTSNCRRAARSCNWASPIFPTRVDAAQAAIKSIVTVVSPLRLLATPPVRRRAPPSLRQHTEEVLAELGLDGSAIAALRTAGVV